MIDRVRNLAVWFVLPALMVPIVAGCNSSNGLPSALTIELPDGSSVKADKGAGAPSLANSSWRFFRTAENGQGTAFVTVVFDENGALERFEDNTLVRDIFGSTILFDGKKHPTSQAGLDYAAATYGAQTADATGFTFEGRVTAFAVVVQAASATASATGVFDPDDPNTVRGTFTFSSVVTLISIPEGNQSDEFSYVGQRLIGE